MSVIVIMCCVADCKLALFYRFLRQDKESWIRSKYVEKKFIHKLPETGRGTPLRRSSARRQRATTHDKLSQRPPIKPKPNRATLARTTGYTHTSQVNINTLCCIENIAER